MLSEGNLFLLITYEIANIQAVGLSLGNEPLGMLPHYTVK